LIRGFIKGKSAMGWMLILMCWFGSVSAADFAGRDVMNGLSWDQYGNFAEEWRLFTVRYREDTREMRFVYANPLAWEALQAGRTDYPDGAAFAKTGAMMKPDPAFPSSLVPSGTRRFQLMVRDKKRFSDTDGWGYALFDQDGKTFAEEPRATALACAACHRLVADRGFVFSQPLTFLPPPSIGPAWRKRLHFESAGASVLPPTAVKFLPRGSKTIRKLTGPLEKNLFQGTLDEIKPLLAEEARRSKLPAVLLDPKGRRFSMVIPEKKKCSGGKGEIFDSYHTSLKGGAVVRNQFCHQ
jgi:hypothetical protein